ncbi:hypothetical protein NPIL_270281 [Nephila pilipes]|uniref:Uncharacterized protein n=1 Tax=Nephila pilipes TaxID=299642 RepID=A0A8X6TKF9_NEPPI|nr:hypothetical protein NPIL_270281 [Nephila pilipes]
MPLAPASSPKPHQIAQLLVNQTEQYFSVLLCDGWEPKISYNFFPYTMTGTEMDFNSKMDYSSDTSSRVSSPAPGSPVYSPCNRRRNLANTISLPEFDIENLPAT